MTCVIHRLKKTTSMTVSSSQKLSEMQYYNAFHYGIKRKMGVIL